MSPALSAETDPLPLSTARAVPLHQPFVHDLVGVFHAPVQAWSTASGSLEGHGAQGIFIGDTRVASDLRIASEGAELSPMGTQVCSAREVVFRDVVSLPDAVVDPIVTLHRRRTADAGCVSEQLRLVSDDLRSRRVRLCFGLVTDSSTMSQVKDPRLLSADGSGRPDATLEDAGASWPIGANGGRAGLDISDGGDGLVVDGAIVTWCMELEAPPGGEAVASWRLNLSDPAVPFAGASGSWAGSSWADGAQPEAAASGNASAPGVGSEAAPPTGATGPGPAAVSASAAQVADPEQRAASLLLERSLSDLDALRLEIPGHPEQTFFAAGAPWYFTLFGRDSLIAASLTLPVDHAIAEGTLRTLAARQGREVEVSTAQQPGKMLHEVRAQGMEMSDSHLPPVYYGTIDATPLWIELLHDARAAGLGDSAFAALRPALVRTSTWLLEHADADGDGLLEYFDETGHGLANQGWKDSGDSIRFADGSLAEGAIALAEVQGYAYAAAVHSAAMLEDGALAHTGGENDLPDRLRDWAAALKQRFHDTFWCEDELGPYIALALDGDKRVVDGVASNMGHLLGTGLLDALQERIVVDRLMHPSMFSGYGIRTLSTTNGGYGPLRYHGGSVWTHDTGYILRGMLRAGFSDEARVLARGLLRAAAGFEQRLPELFSGEGVDEVEPPLPYPASCRPQAWAAASAVPVAQALGVI